MDKLQIGENAGIIWRKLETKGTLSFEELQTETGLGLEDIFAAVGWLAREDKITFNKEKSFTSVRLYQERYY